LDFEADVRQHDSGLRRGDIARPHRFKAAAYFFVSNQVAALTAALLFPIHLRSKLTRRTFFPRACQKRFPPTTSSNSAKPCGAWPKMRSLPAARKA
ncbi:hypothetical protein PQQ96_36385, partial [Paraburkholderia sediminicola]|uniref:hypothetical protein n=1 Tax=Paraburkholderia sediminicola TaxID=458836 RepID=UPI0038B9E75D